MIYMFVNGTSYVLKHHGLPMYESSHAMKHFSMEGSFHFNFMNYGLRMDVSKNGSFQLPLLRSNALCPMDGIRDCPWLVTTVA